MKPVHSNYVLQIPLELDITLTKDITFSYEEAEEKLTSIRGKGTDIADFMSSSLTTPISTGYNALQFNLVNNEAEGKDIAITMISRDLNINHRIDVSLGPDQTRGVQIPLFISEDIKSGTYPVRIGVNDENDKQVRYTYIIVENN